MRLEEIKNIEILTEDGEKGWLIKGLVPKGIDESEPVKSETEMTMVIKAKGEINNDR